jgi:SAM-dependent methyltransferase
MPETRTNKSALNYEYFEGTFFFHEETSSLKPLQKSECVVGLLLEDSCFSWKGGHPPEAAANIERVIMATYDAWAEYYDFIHTGAPGDVEFYAECAVKAGGDVLELGVGTGRIALPLVLSGVNVTGVDNSEGMLAICREKHEMLGSSKGKLRLVCSDMSHVRFRRKFPCVTMPYRTFMHLFTPAEQRVCLANVRARLADDGIFVMNTWAARPSVIAKLQNPRKAGKLKLASRYRFKDEGLTLLHFQSSECDEQRQLLTERHVLRELEDDGRVVQETELPLVRAWTTQREIENMFHLCGFEIAELYGDFMRGPFTTSSVEMIYVLRKTRLAQTD